MDGDVVVGRVIVAQLGWLYRGLGPFRCGVKRFSSGMVPRAGGVVKLFHGGAAGTTKAALGGLGPALSLAVAYGVGCVELFGGLMLAVGLLTLRVALCIIIKMTVVVLLKCPIPLVSGHVPATC